MYVFIYSFESKNQTEWSESAKSVLINHWKIKYNWLEIQNTWLSFLQIYLLEEIISFKNGPESKILICGPLFFLVLTC